jgi:hypothetical protein
MKKLVTCRYLDIAIVVMEQNEKGKSESNYYRRRCVKLQ